MQRFLYVLLGVLLVPTVGLVGDIVTDGTFRSTAPPGIPPLEVESTDRVDNLNADMLDGIEGDQLFLRSEVYTRAEVDALIAAAVAAGSRPWFYLTTTRYTGAEAATACDAGFHMASMWEILDVSNLRYDTVRGYTDPGGDGGPPIDFNGWIRVASTPFGGDIIGLANCEAWTSSLGTDYGTGVALDAPAQFPWDGPTTRISPWTAYTYLCSSEEPVWCIQD